MLLQFTGALPQSFPYTKASSEVILVWCGKFVELESTLEA
jgi:hypothetical protein